MIVDHDNQRVLEVLENREKATVLAYLQQAKQEGLLAHVAEVTTDMWDAYVTAAREAFGEQVAITIDRFHVMKNFQECLTVPAANCKRSCPKRRAAYADRGPDGGGAQRGRGDPGERGRAAAGRGRDPGDRRPGAR